MGLFTRADVDRIPILDGAHWIEVKRDLNTGELKKLESIGTKPPVFTGEGADRTLVNPIDWEVYEIGKVMIWLRNWSLVNDDDGQPVPLSQAAVKALEPDVFDEINRAIITHSLERAKAKKAAREAKVKADKAAKEDQLTNSLPSTPTASDNVSDPPST